MLWQRQHLAALQTNTSRDNGVELDRAISQLHENNMTDLDMYGEHAQSPAVSATFFEPIRLVKTGTGIRVQPRRFYRTFWRGLARNLLRYDSMMQL
jgi:hypothetical protein